MELGLTTFADIAPGMSAERRMGELLEEAELADQLGLDLFALGEHHRPDYLVSSPVVVLAAIAARTQRIRLSSAVTVLGSDDPVRVFEQFAELDLLSGGRAEIMVGRGDYIESFPLFGFDLGDSDELFAEKLELLLKIRESERVSWSGRLRPPLHEAIVGPRPVQDPLPVWIAAGGTPQSMVRAGKLGLSLTLAVLGSPNHRLGSSTDRFVPMVGFYRQSARSAGHADGAVKLALNVHAFVGRTVADADAAFAVPYLERMNQIGRERNWVPLGRDEYEALRAPQGVLNVGTPEQVAEKILFQHELFANDRYIAQMTFGTVAHRDVLRAIELFGTEVAPIVRAEVARRQAT